MWGGDMMGWGWGWFGMVHMVLWWLLIILGIVVLAKWLFSSGVRSSAADPNSAANRIAAGDRALAILRERYARGEIDKQEYEARRSDLES